MEATPWLGLRWTPPGTSLKSYSEQQYRSNRLPREGARQPAGQPNRTTSPRAIFSAQCARASIHPLPGGVLMRAMDAYWKLKPVRRQSTSFPAHNNLLRDVSSSIGFFLVTEPKANQPRGAGAGPQPIPSGVHASSCCFKESESHQRTRPIAARSRSIAVACLPLPPGRPEARRLGLLRGGRVRRKGRRDASLAARARSRPVRRSVGVHCRVPPRRCAREAAVAGPCRT